MLFLANISSGSNYKLLYYAQVVQLYANNRLCVNQLITNYQQLQFCQKVDRLSSKIVIENLTHVQQSQMHYALYATKVQSSVLNFAFSHSSLSSFALFGLSQELAIDNSNLSVKIPHLSAQSALICFTCDAVVQKSLLSFACSGFNVSGVALYPFKFLTLSQTFVQSRLNGSQNCGGLLLVSSSLIISITNCQIQSYLSNGGYISASSESSTLSIASSSLCSNSNNNVKVGSQSETGSFLLSCDLCVNSYNSFGLCEPVLEFGHVFENSLVCNSGFVFDGQKCVCLVGTLFQSSCVDVLQNLNQILSNDKTLNDFTLENRILNNISKLTSELDIPGIHQTATSLSEQFASLKQTVLSQNALIDQNQKTVINPVLNLVNLTVLNITAQNALIDNVYTNTELDNQVQMNMNALRNSLKSRGVGEITQSFVYRGDQYVHQHQTYVLCSGAATQGVYPNLYAMGLINIPNMNDTFLKGTNNQVLSNDQNYYNANSITLTVDQLPAHTHSSRGYSDTPAYGGWEITGNGTPYDYATSSTGGGQSVNIEPRHKVVYYYITVD
ncbi:Hypothetical_protein [Hexamita inflata]|uniref:Hypothetical_protein n=1 Tax=Hexamita inflata TaxID=28002 RepID=A0AA86RHX6_9EUKA|nr:Hypothetical protein HINF_LOCUS61433 [Hexamita inflata]